jgi:hypothetical protein
VKRWRASARWGAGYTQHHAHYTGSNRWTPCQSSFPCVTGADKVHIHSHSYSVSSPYQGKSTAVHHIASNPFAQMLWWNQTRGHKAPMSHTLVSSRLWRSSWHSNNSVQCTVCFQRSQFQAVSSVPTCSTEMHVKHATPSLGLCQYVTRLDFIHKHSYPVFYGYEPALCMVFSLGRCSLVRS